MNTIFMMAKEKNSHSFVVSFSDSILSHNCRPIIVITTPAALNATRWRLSVEKEKSKLFVNQSVEHAGAEGMQYPSATKTGSAIAKSAVMCLPSKRLLCLVM